MIENQIGVGGLVISQKEKDMVNEVLDSNRLSYGKYSKLFEENFAKEHQCDFAVLSNSGTSSLEVALAAMKEHYQWNDDDEVICPATTFVATVNIVLYNKLKPVLVDVEDVYYEIDSSLIEEKITSKTRCILVVHLFGHPCDMNPIWEIAKKHNLRILEDSCETMFAKYDGKSVGNLGDVACFSTYIAHILVSGVGGISTTNIPELALLMRSLVNHGRNGIYLSIDDDKNLDEKKLTEVIEKRFQFVRCGYSYRITEMEAALAFGQLQNKDFNISRRREIANFYISSLREYSSLIQLPTVRKNSEHVFMMFPILILSESFSKKDFTTYLEINKIETRDMLPLVNQPCYKNIFREEDYPVSKKIIERGFYIGSHPYITDDETKYIINKISIFLDDYK